MDGIGKFLEKYLNFTPPALVRTRAVSKAIFEICNSVCPEDVVTIRGDVAMLRVSGVLKSEILLHKKEILARAKELGAGGLEDLR
jgi:hypothetical protein